MAIYFLIVGGGIGAAVLANLLGRRGKRVVVLAKSRTPVPQNRPEILWPATVEVLRTLIPKNLEERWLLPLRGGMVMRGRQPLLQFGPELFQGAGVQPYSTANTRELLLQQAPCEHQRGREVTEVLHDRGRVVGVRTRDTAGGAEREMLAQWTVGDDGVHSVIRRGCGLRIDIAGFAGAAGDGCAGRSTALRHALQFKPTSERGRSRGGGETDWSGREPLAGSRR